MTLWIVAGSLVILSTGLIIWPLLRGRYAEMHQSDYDLAVYRDQLKEIDEDLARGMIAADEAKISRLEIQRRLLSVAADKKAAPQGSGKIVAFLVTLLLAGGGTAVYLKLGSPNLPDQPQAERSAQAKDDAHRMAGLVDQLAEKLKANPNDQRGWAMLARSYISLERYPQAVEAYLKLISLGVDAAEIHADLGEALMLAAGGDLTPQARKAFADALKRDPKNVKARFFEGVTREQDGDFVGAITAWKALLAEAKDEDEWQDLVRERVLTALLEAGQIFKDKGKIAEAKQSWTEARDMLDPSSEGWREMDKKIKELER
jgi:cytochrome c-type biogenesis protein CcmH